MRGKGGVPVGEPQEVGKVVSFYGKIGVAAVEVTGEIKVGDTLHFKGHTTDFKSAVESMQSENQPVERAGPGDKVGIRVPEKVRDGDRVYKVEASP